MVPLQAEAMDAVAVDPAHLAVLLGRNEERAVRIVSSRTGDSTAEFPVAAGAEQLGYAGAQSLLDSAAGPAGVVEIRSPAGAVTSTVKLGAPILALAGADERHAFALVGGRSPRVVEIDLTSARVAGAVEPPAGTVSLAAHASGPEASLVAGTRDGGIYLRLAGAPTWDRIAVDGNAPVFSLSGSAIYAFQTVGDSKGVAVIQLPSQLQVRLFPVSLDARRMFGIDDGTLGIFEQSGKAANVRLISCASPMLAVEARSKHSKFSFGDGQQWSLLGLATPDPDETQAPRPDSTGAAYAGC